MKNVHNFGIFQPIWLKLSMWSLTGRTPHMNSIYKDSGMLTGQTSLPPNQPTGLKVKNVHIFGVFQPIWLIFGMESLNRRTQHVYVIYMHLSMLTGQTDLPPNQPTYQKVKTCITLSFFNQFG